LEESDRSLSQRKGGHGLDVGSRARLGIQLTYDSPKPAIIG
jgi:hypothetical protein